MPLKGSLKFRCTPEFKARLKAAAKRRKRSMSNYAVHALEQFLDEEEQAAQRLAVKTKSEEFNSKAEALGTEIAAEKVERRKRGKQ